MTAGDDAERRADRFAAWFAERAPTRADRGRLDALRPEAATVMEAIVEAVGGGPLPRAEGPELREALTLASLLGRSAAYLELTPAAALAIGPAIVAALEGTVDLAPLTDVVVATVIDGYVRACEERERERAAQRASEAIPIVELAPKCFAFVLRGLQDPDALERRVDELGRALFARDGRACVVDLTGLAEPDRERLGPIFAVHSTCSMLGARAIYVGLSDPWRVLAEEARVDLSIVSVAPTFADALEQALRHCGLEVRPPSRLAHAVTRLLGRR
ncbi:MAG: hypothetical protein KF729_21315 [Sandaracinaceae bacterium]|nr:hypothetical protein [Sandaracinaceae bacterium]